jgi:flagellar export protein FliJ
MQGNRARYGDQLQRMLDGVLHIDEIEHQYRYLTALDDQLTTQRMAIAVAEEAVESARARLEEALKKRKRLEKLKEYDQQSFELTMRQREANQLDDINIARYNRSDR